MTRPTPAMFDHAVKVYAAMAELAKEEEVEIDDDVVSNNNVKVYTGHLTTLFQRLEMSMPYYTAVMKGLKALNCVEQLRRGGGNAESKWILLEAPTEEGWRDYEENKRSKAPQGKVAAIDQRVKNHEERLTRIEDFLQTMKV